MSQSAKEVVPVDLTEIPRQSFSESTLKEHGSVWFVKDEPAPFGGQEVHLWDQYRKFRKQVSEYGDDASDQAKAIGSRLNQVDLTVFKSPWTPNTQTRPRGSPALGCDPVSPPPRPDWVNALKPRPRVA
jgi:hypothetical protein